jgi:hypothetical protein
MTLIIGLVIHNIKTHNIHATGRPEMLLKNEEVG